MKKILYSLVVCSILISCSPRNNLIAPIIHKAEFPGFKFADNEISTRLPISGYEYQTLDGDKLSIENCHQANTTDKSKIADFDYFRFNLLLASCTAIDRYSNAGISRLSYFPAVLKHDFYARLPAAVAPPLSKADLLQRHGKSIIDFDKETQISIVKPNAAKLLTKDEEIYITVLAMGDFTGDDLEDMLVQVESYAREAFGKHVDLLILSKIEKVAQVRIYWRSSPIK